MKNTNINIEDLQLRIANAFFKNDLMCTINYEFKNNKPYRKVTMADHETPGLVDYPLNSEYYRSVEFDEKPPILAIGCSITWGTGLPEHARWSNIISEMSGLKSANLAFPGCGVETIISNTFNLMKKYDYKPKYIFALMPNFERARYLSFAEYEMESNKPVGYSLRSIKYEKGKVDLNEIIPPEYAFFKTLSYIKILETFCKQSGIKFAWTTWADHKGFESMFDSYFVDQVPNYFPRWGGGPEWTTNEEKRKKAFQFETTNCHSEEENKHLDYFYYAYDNRLPVMHNGFKRFGPHPGMHQNIHWAEQFYAKMTEDAII